MRERKGTELSGGERRRVEIARCLALEPQFILLDEPFAGVDPLAVADIQEIVQYLRERGMGILITDHNVRETLHIVDRAYIYDNSIDGQLPRLLYRTVDGTVFKKYTDDIPEWAQTICQWSR